jgi:hypothetical protein
LFCLPLGALGAGLQGARRTSETVTEAAPLIKYGVASSGTAAAPVYPGSRGIDGSHEGMWAMGGDADAGVLLKRAQVEREFVAAIAAVEIALRAAGVRDARALVAHLDDLASARLVAEQDVIAARLYRAMPDRIYVAATAILPEDPELILPAAGASSRAGAVARSGCGGRRRRAAGS